MKSKFRITSVLIAGLFSTSAFATDGYFSHGYGVKAQGIGGAGIALPQDGLAAATNPAGTAFVPSRLDVGLTWFAPKRSAQIVGNAFGADATYDGNGKSNFFIPEFGYIGKFGEKTTAGVAVYGNGGMNTQYTTNPYGRFGSTGNAGVNLEQLFISPSVAFKLDDQNAIGLALNFAYQRFSAEGLNAFAGASANPANLTNRGTDTATGWGIRLGWTGQVTPDLTLGATWASKTKTGKLNNYSGLFANGGSFDIPENFGVGVAYKVVPEWTFAADVERIKYGNINSIANPLSNLTVHGNPLGSAFGPGFGWRNITVYKLGASYAYTPDVTLRVGYNHSDQPIPADQTFFNILAPATVQDHLTVGGTWKNSATSELSFAYVHALKKTVNGANSIPPGVPPGFGGGNANISLKENIFGVAYGWKF